MARRRILGRAALLGAILALALAWLPGVSASPQPQATVTVSVADNSFQPQSLTITAGDTVVWTNNGSNPHTSTSDTGLWDSGTLSPGQTFSRVFDTPGTFPYHCAFHQGLGMVGTITVQAAAPAATATPTPLPPTATPTSVPPTATPTPAVATPTTTPTPAPTLKITSPTEGETVTGTEAAVRVQISNFTLAPEAIGKANQPGQGHWHILLDGKLVKPVGTDSFTLTGLTAGPHAIKVELHNNDHSLLSLPVEATVNITVVAPKALPKTGEGNLTPWVLLLAGLAIVAGLTIRVTARR